MKLPIHYDPLSRTSTWFVTDPVTNTFKIQTEQDVSHILEANKAMALDTDRTKLGIKRDMVHYARIPDSVIMKWKAEKGVDLFDKSHRKAVFKLINDPEYKYLKATHMTHGG